MILSNKKTPELNTKMQRILDLKNNGQYATALKEAKVLIAEYPTIASVYGLAGSIYFIIDRYDEAAPKFKRATEISPKSEAASLGLFHSLWELGRYAEAFGEMKRYLSVAESDEYSELQEQFLKEPKERI